jgi:hypothetical protein
MDDSDKYRVDSQPQETPAPATKPSEHKKRIGLWIALIVVAIAVVGGLFYFMNHKTTKPKKQITAQKIIQIPSSSNSTATTKYVSNGSDLSLSFSHPSNWSVTPPTNDNPNDQTITLTSPLFSVVNADGASVVGKIIIQVRPGSDTVSELNNNSPVAALASAQIAYSQPTSSQTSYPYLSYFHFSDGSKASGAFEEVIITGGQSFPLGQAVSAEYLSGLDPIISASFYQCATQSCSGSNQTLLSITSTTWDNVSIFQQALTTLESFQLN